MFLILLTDRNIMFYEDNIQLMANILSCWDLLLVRSHYYLFVFFLDSLKFKELRQENKTLPKLY